MLYLCSPVSTPVLELLQSLLGVAPAVSAVDKRLPLAGHLQLLLSSLWLLVLVQWMLSFLQHVQPDEAIAASSRRAQLLHTVHRVVLHDAAASWLMFVG